MTDSDVTAARDLMRGILENAGIKPRGVAFDDRFNVYEVWLDTYGYVNRKTGEYEPHKARVALAAALRKAGYGVSWRSYELAGGEYFCRFTIEAAGAGS